MHMLKKQSGFTIVELLVVIVVIGILAAISIVSFNGVTAKAEEVVVKSDLKNASTQLEITKIETGSYPATGADLKRSDGTEFTYTFATGNYCLSATRTNKPAIIFHVSSSNQNITDGACPGPTPTVATCFAFSAGTITNYYDNESNSGSNPACPRAVVIPNTLGGVSVQSIANYALQNKQLTSIVMPNTITNIGEYGLAMNSFTTLTLPSSLATIGDAAFSHNLITSIVIPSGVTSIPLQAFYNNRLTSATIPSSVTSISYFSFGANLLTSVSIPTATTTQANSFDGSVTVTRY